MALNSSRRLLPSLLVAAVLSCSWPGSVIADPDRVEVLEARVAELELLVRQLLQNQAVMEEGAETLTVETATVETAGPDATVIKAREILQEQQPAAAEEAEIHQYAWGGYVKADVLYSVFGGGPVATGSPGRDFYIPTTVPVGHDGESYLDFSAKETRINFTSSHILDNGARLGTMVEMDFLLSGQGDDRVSNSYSPRLRQAFLTYDKWLFGQTWMTLFNVAALPENLDFVGPAESTIFGRQVMIRYTNGPWQFSVENPETTVTPYRKGDDRIVADHSQLPDGIVRYNLERDWGSFTAAAIVRQLAYEVHSQRIDDVIAGYGISFSGVFRLAAQDDFRWMVSAGKGLGRYIGLNTTNGAVLDAEGELHAIGVFGIFGSYRHFWSERWRSNLTLGYLSVDNDVALTGLLATRNAESIHLNLIYNPLPRLDFGIEFMYADRELESGIDGDLKRFQFSARYAY